MCRAMMPLMTETVQYCFSPAIDPQPGGMVFSAMTTTPDLFRASLRYAREHGLKRIGMLTPTDATGQDGDRALALALASPENASLKVVSSEHFAPADISVTAQVAKIRDSDPQLIIAWASGTAIGTVLRAINDAGIEAPIVTSTANQTFGQMTALQSLLPKGGLLFPSTELTLHNVLRRGPLKDAQDRIITAYRRIGQPVPPQAVTAWDPASIVLEALRHVGPTPSARQVHDYMENMHSYAGVMGIYNFSDGSQRGIGLSSVVMARWAPERNDWVAVSGAGGAPLR